MSRFSLVSALAPFAECPPIPGSARCGPDERTEQDLGRKTQQNKQDRPPRGPRDNSCRHGVRDSIVGKHHVEREPVDRRQLHDLLVVGPQRAQLSALRGRHAGLRLHGNLVVRQRKSRRGLRVHRRLLRVHLRRGDVLRVGFHGADRDRQPTVAHGECVV